jgi:excisionase family DNA binding protein
MPEATPARALPLAPLVLSPRQAAHVLAISERTLWTLTHRGDIPAVRIGRAVRYDPRDLAAYVERRKATPQRNGKR